ncbi:uncharacterized protein LOC111519037 [Drosophila willistoni]|uniref:uncharacterized protein LOC111519037 n=1 Tax=Drosophila willistoni TaxID=7260 RepID=UPI000C26C2DB|nr:uncharacterized protein LOC111519037 [Drosophila willistoni]
MISECDTDTASMVAQVDDDSELESEFVELNEKLRRITFDVIASLNDDGFQERMRRLLMQYEQSVRISFEISKQCPQRSRKLARMLSGQTEIIHSISRCMHQDRIYCHRMSNIVAYYISSELCAAQSQVEREELIIDRINLALKSYVPKSKEHLLRTFVAIPSLFNRVKIMTTLYSHLFPQWTKPLATNSNVIIQAELPDKLYIEYVVIFYYWQCLERNEGKREEIMDFAEKFMRPAKTLILNTMYAKYLPRYTERRTATRCILMYLRKITCTHLHMASKRDNRMQQDTEVILCSDDEDDSLVPYFSSTAQSANVTPPAFLQKIIQKCRQMEPCKRATLLFKGIDSSMEIVDISDSDDDDVEMFEVDFNVPTHVDAATGTGSGGGVGGTAVTSIEDDYVPITRIYPSNLRTYQRATSGAPPPVPAPSPSPAIHYTLPRIVNIYSCREDSLHMVTTTTNSTTCPLVPHLIDQSVQTVVEEDEEEPLQEPAEEEEEMLQTEMDLEPNDISTSILYTGDSAPTTQSTTQQQQHLLYSTQTPLSSSTPSSSIRSGRNGSSSHKQVTFSTQHTEAIITNNNNNNSFIFTSKKKKPAIKKYSSPAASSTERLKWQACKDHLLAGDRMFAKVLPTPPASIHSSVASPHFQRSRTSTDTISSIDNDKLEATMRSYSFKRREFSKVGKEDVRFYNELLSRQRQEMRQRREDNGQNHYNRHLRREAIQKAMHYRAQIKQRLHDIKQLEQYVEVIRNYNERECVRPVCVRLKRCKLKKTTPTPLPMPMPESVTMMAHNIEQLMVDCQQQQQEQQDQEEEEQQQQQLPVRLEHPEPLQKINAYQRRRLKTTSGFEFADNYVKTKLDLRKRCKSICAISMPTRQQPKRRCKSFCLLSMVQ